VTEDLGRSFNTFYIIYTNQRDITTPARVGMNTCELTTVASRDLAGPNIQHAFSVTGPPNLIQDAASPQRVPSYFERAVFVSHFHQNKFDGILNKMDST